MKLDLTPIPSSASKLDLTSIPSSSSKLDLTPIAAQSANKGGWFKSVAEDALGTTGPALALLSAMSKRPKQAKDLIGGLSKADKDFIADLKSIGTQKYNLADLLAPASNLAPSQEVSTVVSKIGTPSDLTYKAADFLGNVAPYDIGGGLLDATRGSIEGAPLIGKAASWLGQKGVPGVLKRSIGAAIGGAFLNPNNRLEGAIEGAVLSPLVEGASQGVPAGYNSGKAIIRKLAKNPENIAKNINLLGQSPLSVFDLAENQGGQRFLNNWIGEVPFSGVHKDIKANVENLNNHVSNFMNKLLGKTGEHNINDEVKQNIIDNYINKKKIDKQNYDNVATAAENANISIPSLPATSTLAKNILDQNEASMAQNLPSKLDGRTQKLLSNLSTTGMKLKSVFSPSKMYSQQQNLFSPSIPQLVSTRSFLGDKSEGFYKAGDNYQGKVYADLKTALTNDINNALEKSGNGNIQNLGQIANQYHKDEIAPYKQGNLVTRLMQNQNPLKSATPLFMKGQNQKIFNDLSPEIQNNIRYQLLQPKAALIEKGKPVYESSNILGNYKKLTAQEKKSLFTDSQQKHLNNLRQLYNVNAENILSLKKPATGFQKYGEVIKPLIAGIASYAAFHNPALLASVTTPSIAARALNKALRSPRLIRAAVSPYRKTFQTNPGIIQKAILANALQPSNKGGNQ